MYYLGIDLGGTNIAAGLVNEKFELIAKDSVPTGAHRTDREIVKDMATLCLKIMADNNIQQSQVSWIGIGSPGTCDPLTGVLVYSNNLPFSHTPIRTWMQEDINLPVHLSNDANCAALGEAYGGATKDANDSLMITIGTGLGGGIIINRRIYSGCNGAGGELGHTCIIMDGEPCSCGRSGCWEAYASANALKRQTWQAVQENPQSKLAQMVEHKQEKISGKTAFDAMRGGCPIGQAVVDRYIKYLATGLVDMINIFQPDILAIGGGVCKEGEYLLNPLEKLVEGMRYTRDVKQTKLCVASLGNDAGIIGAAVLGL